MIRRRPARPPEAQRHRLRAWGGKVAGDAKRIGLLLGGVLALAVGVALISQFSSGPIAVRWGAVFCLLALVEFVRYLRRRGR